MLFVYLCGGAERSHTPGTFPRPLNLLLGHPQIGHSARGLASERVLFVYSSFLSSFRFEARVRALFPGMECLFAATQFATRGPLETALAGLLAAGDAVADGEPLVFLDNDGLYAAEHVAALAAAAGSAFVGCHTLEAPLPAHAAARLCFLAVDGGGCVTAVAEKRRVSDTFAVGAYGFASRAQFSHWARRALEEGPFTQGVIYVSAAFSAMIAGGAAVRALPLSVPTVDGWDAPPGEGAPLPPLRRMRLCFELDGTLVVQGAAGAEPAPDMVDCARWARSEGHAVIIHTQRAATAASAAETFACLAEMGIPFDEVIFGKPAADVYIDARSCNPALGSLRAMGVPHGPPLLQPVPIVNALPNNNVNTLRLEGGRVVKRGPARHMRGELFFYESLARMPSEVRALFPQFFGGGEGGGAAADLGGAAEATLTLEYVQGVPLTSLLHHQLMTPFHLSLLLRALDALHASAGVPVTLGTPALREHYLGKLEARFRDPAYAAAADGAAVQAEVLRRVAAYVDGRPPPAVAPVIHGDCWFANVLLQHDNALKFIDMRGQVAGALSVNGDPNYDLAKVVQSLVGFDAIVFGLPPVPHAYRLGLVRAFAGMLRARNPSLPATVLDIAAALVAGVLPFYDDEGTRAGVWALATQLLRPTEPHLKDFVDAFREPLVREAPGT
jgi:hypothetical protein